MFMIRANVYSIESLSEVASSAILEGIGMAVSYMGETVTSKLLTVRLPLDAHGRVEPRRVGHGKLDKLVELHLMAVPIDPGDGERLGIAGCGRGVGYVDISKDSEPVIRTTTAHEVAHAFGFVTPGAKHEDPSSAHHCANDFCLMHQVARIEKIDEVKPDFKFRDLFKPWHKLTRTNYFMSDQHDFCLDCKVDMRDGGERHLANLRRARILQWKGVRLGNH